MIEINLHEVIDEATNNWMYDWLGMNRPFSLETLQDILKENEGNTKAIRLNIHCDGGNVMEGLAIYDALRTSGRNIYCNVEGKCHSMAITLLLAAPKSQRSAQPNAQFLIHEVSGGVEGNTTAIERYAEECRKLQNKILDIYADRTGWDRVELAEIMSEEKFRDAEFMLAHGFIGSINKYNTNTNKMNIIDRLKELIGTAEQEGAANAAPNENETKMQQRIAELEQQVADMQQSADTARQEAEAAANTASEALNAMTAERDAANAALVAMTAERDAALANVAEREQQITDLQKQVASHFTPAERNAAQGGAKPSVVLTREQEKAEAKEKFNAAMKGAKK